MRLTSVAVALLGSVAAAAPRTLVVGSGECQNADLVSGVNEFSAALRDRLRADLYEPDVVLDIVRPRPTRTLEDVERQVESARTLFFNGQLERSLDLLKQALVELERAPVAGQPWKVTAQALVLQGVVSLSLNKKPDALESFRRVLRVEPTHALNGDEFAPSVISQFEAVKRELARLKKTQVQFQSSRSGDEVLVDGRVIGTTPAKLELIPGTYRVLLRSKDRVSFVRVITTPRDALVNVDLATEGTLAVQPPLCLDAKDKAAEAAALKLANTVTADDLVLVRVEGKGTGTVVASRYEIRTGTMLREGRVQRSKQAYSALATFLLTGQGSSDLLAPGAQPKPTEVAVVQPTKTEPVKVEPVKTDPVKVERAKELSRPDLTAPPPPPPSTTLSASRLVGYGLLGVGAIAAISGIAYFGTGAADRTRLAALKQSNGKLPDPSSPLHRDALDLVSRTDSNRTLSVVLIAGGLGLVASGLLTVWLFPGETTVSVAPTGSGGTLVLSGSF